jgi:hypothetical protein
VCVLLFFYSIIYIVYVHTVMVSGNEDKGAFRHIEILRMYFDTSLKTSRRDFSAISSPRHLSETTEDTTMLDKLKTSSVLFGGVVRD